jgi:vancomycin resistance protein YoaR
VLDAAAAARAIDAAIRSGAAGPVVLPVRAVEPRITTADVAAIEGEVARFGTRYGERGNRRRNIDVACQRIDGTVLKPGDVFSYNEIVGPRDAESGFRLAPVIVRGRLEPGLGGGVCQVSSTLYNAVLLANLEVVRRTHHAFPVHYVPPGRDATVVYGSLDLRFRNSTDSPIAVVARSDGGRVEVRILGKPVPGRTVRIERTNISTRAQPTVSLFDPGLPEGRTATRDKGHPGRRVTVWRIVLEHGREVAREVVSRDVYRPFPRIVVRGTRPTDAAPEPPSALPGEPEASGPQPQ